MPYFCSLYGRCGGETLIRSLALLLSLAVFTPVLLAQDWDHDHLNGRDKIHDPTGTWLVRIPVIVPLNIEFVLFTFNKGGTVTSDIQGENGFDPNAVPEGPRSSNNVITSPGHGTWQKTGWNTFVAEMVSIEYHISTDTSNSLANFGSPLFRFDRTQFTGTLSQSGDRMTLDNVTTFFDAHGNQQDGDGNPGTMGFQSTSNGVRIPLDFVPNSSHHLPIPPSPQVPTP